MSAPRPHARAGARCHCCGADARYRHPDGRLRCGDRVCDACEAPRVDGWVELVGAGLREAIGAAAEDLRRGEMSHTDVANWLLELDGRLRAEERDMAGAGDVGGPPRGPA